MFSKGGRAIVGGAARTYCPHKYWVRARREDRDRKWMEYSRDRAKAIEFLHKFFHMRHRREVIRKMLRRRIDGIQERKRELLKHPR